MGSVAKLTAAALALAVLTAAEPTVAGVPLPCTGDKSFKMADRGITRKDGVMVYLGYRYPGCGGGEWIGYINDRTFVKLPGETAARMLATAGGFDGLPPPPSRLAHPAAFWVEWLWAAIIGFVVVGSTLSAAFSGPAAARGPKRRLTA